MTDDTSTPQTPDTPDTPETSETASAGSGGRSRRRRRRWLMFTGLPLLAIGGVFAAKALADHRHGGHHGHRWGGLHGAKTEQDLRERMGDKADRMARYLDLTDSQRGEIDAILDTTAPQLFALKSERGQLHKQMFEAVRSGDQARIEAARKAGIAHFDAASKVWVETAQLAYDVLDAEQKAEVMEHVERFAPHHD